MTDGVRRLSHEEAEMLISARMDEHLDRADSRALLVHLQTCESCRAFAVQSEILGRELNALPVLPPSALVDRQIRASIANGRRRWSLGALVPATGGGGGLRLAVGALAMLTLVSVFLLVRMADDQSGEGPSIDAPNGGVAQQLDRTPTAGALALEQTAGPTETARVVVPRTPESESTDVSAPTEAADSTDDTSAAVAEPTRTLDSSFVYTRETTPTPESAALDPTEPADVAAAAVADDAGTPVDDTDAPSDAVDTPVSTEDIATPTEEDAETPTAPADEPSAESTLPAETPADAPATGEPATTVTEPTATPTPVEISVDATETPGDLSTPTSVATAETIAVESPAGSSSPTAPVDPLTETPSAPAPTETPAAPFAQPTIAPMSGQTGSDQGTGDDQGDDSPQIVSNDGSDDDGNRSGDSSGSGSEPSGGDADGGGTNQGTDDGQNDSTGNASGTSPQIVPADGTNVPDGVGGDNGETAYGGDADAPSAVPTVDDSIQPFGLDLSDTVTELPSGSTSPVGRLEFSPGMNLFVVVAPDGQLAVADLAGELVVTLGSADLPVWSGSGLMFSTPGETGAQVSIWNSDTGDLSVIPSSENEASDDVPVGGNGSAFYFLRIYPESGILELRSATIAGEDQGVLWTSDAVTLGGERPVYAEEGIYLPTDSEWLFIDWAGNESSLGKNPYGFIGAPVLSPGGGLIAYSAGDQVIVAWTDSPGEALATAPFSAPGGYAFATSGEEVVVSDGSSLHVISYQGEDLGTLSGNQPIGAVYWISETIYYLQIGEDAALMSTSLGSIQSE